jgi:hypothetical protein
VSCGGCIALLVTRPLIHARDDTAAVSGLVKAKHKFEVSDMYVVMYEVHRASSDQPRSALQMHERNPDIESEV